MLGVSEERCSGKPRTGPSGGRSAQASAENLPPPSSLGLFILTLQNLTLVQETGLWPHLLMHTHPGRASISSVTPEGNRELSQEYSQRWGSQDWNLGLCGPRALPTVSPWDIITRNLNLAEIGTLRSHQPSSFAHGSCFKNSISRLDIWVRKRETWKVGL